jgi:membrane protease YdiL (CAAX protease family)
MPPWPVWAWLLGVMLAMLILSWGLDRLGVAAWHVDTGFLLGFGSLAALGTSIVEETVFRGILLKPPSSGKGGWGASALSAILFALWHPFQTFLYHPLWEAYAWAWWFLLGTFLLGFVCARLTNATRSLWPAIVLHWLLSLGWKTLYGIPSCGLVPCVLYQ